MAENIKNITENPEQMKSLFTYLELAKMRITLMALASAGAGFLLSASQNWNLLFHLLVGLLLLGISSNAFNEVMEHKLDAKMDRTKTRPIPDGRLSVLEASVFAGLTGIVGFVYLLIFTSSQIAFMGLSIGLTYLLLYTPMKTKSAFNTIVGALPGALPILTGWYAGANVLDFQGFVLFAIVFVWQIPHFFSIAWIYKEDYEKGGYKMMSFHDATGRQAVILIFVGTIALISTSYLPLVCQLGGLIYLFLICILNTFLFSTSILLMKNREKYMRMYFLTSVIYLLFLMVFLLIDRMLFWHWSIA